MSDKQTDNGLVHLTIDGQPVAVEPGIPIIEAAKRLGIDIPHYCYDPALSIVASCRLCLVEIENVPKLQPSCSAPVSEGQVVYTRSEKVLEARRMQMEFLLVQHPLDCPVCDQGGECKLQDYSMNHGFGASRFRFPKRVFPKPDIGPFIDLERNRCILCSRCVRYMDELAGEAEFAIIDRGNGAYISTFQNQPLKNEFAGNTIDLCPVGALTSKITRFRTRVWELKSVPSICTLCPVGCSTQMQYRNRTHEVLRIVPRENPQINQRWICDIGRFGFDQFNSEERARTPLKKESPTQWQEIGWGKAINDTAAQFKTISEQHGPQAIAGAISPEQNNETLFLFQQFFRAIIGSNHVDHRIDTVLPDSEDGFLASQALGCQNTPLQAARAASTVLLVGSDLPNEAPILHLQLRKQANRGARIYAAHTVSTRMDTVCQDSLTIKPGSELLLLSGLFYWGSRERGMALSDELKKFAQQFNPAEMCSQIGISETQLQNWALALIKDDSHAIFLGQSAFAGEHGKETVRMATELARLLNNDTQGGLPVHLIIPHANSRGAAEMGCHPHRGPSFEPIEPAGKNITEILQGCVDGDIKALFLFDADLIESYPDRPFVEQALETVPFAVTADSFLTKTAEKSSLFLPLSMQPEQDGTYTNMDGIVQRSARALPQLEGTLAGHQLLLALGERWGAAWKQVPTNKITAMISQAVSAYNGAKWESIGKNGYQTKPMQTGDFAKPIHLASPENTKQKAPSAEYPFRFIRGRYLFDRAGKKRYNQALVERSEPCMVEMHPSDADQRGIKENDRVTIRGELGDIRVPVFINKTMQTGCVRLAGMYDDVPVNAVAAPQNPWVNVIR
ncbi:NADH-quinone oxidoreductase subunit NuoG [bacterium]|nr:NADH-quinone oxidoreductase subunit NuoG [bacterium]